MTKVVPSAALVALLALLWHHFLGRLLTAPLSVGRGWHPDQGGSVAMERTLPKTPVGATALRSLRYLRRDPRFIALAVATNWIPWLGWVVLVLGPAWGLLVLRTAIRLSGRYLDDHWPEVLQQVSKPAT